MNSALTDYTFTLKQQAVLPAGSLLFITLPSTISMTATSLCYDLLGDSLNCTQTSYQNVIVTLNSQISSGTAFGAKVSNIRNPPSYRPLTSNFTF